MTEEWLGWMSADDISNLRETSAEQHIGGLQAIVADGASVAQVLPVSDKSAASLKVAMRA